jgi:hypothetical protein
VARKRKADPCLRQAGLTAVGQEQSDGFDDRSWRVVRGVPAKIQGIRSGGDALRAEPAQAREEFVGRGDVAGNLRTQFFRAAEFLLLTEALPESHFDALGRRLRLKIEQVRFDAECRAVERRAHTDIRDRAVAAFLAFEKSSRDVNAASGKQFLLGDKI